MTGAHSTPSLVDGAPARWRTELDRLRHVASDVALFRVVFLAIGWLAVWLATAESVRPDFGLDHWLQWDAHHYLAIAERGYADSVADGNSAGFFPGFPFFVRVVVAVSGVSYLVAGMVVTLLATVVAAYFLHRLAELDHHDPDRAVLGLLLFPTAVFLVAPYTEPLFLAGAVPAFYYARLDRPLTAAPFAFLATFARSIGPLLAVGVLVELLCKRSSRQLVDPRRLATLGAVAIAGVLPALIHGLVFREREGTIFAYAEAQSRIAGRGPTNPIDGFLTTARTWWSGASANNVVTFQLELVFAVLAAALLLWLLLRREWGYATFVGLLLAVSLAAPYYLSTPRFALTMFPFAFLIADLSRSPRWDGRLLPILACTATLGVATFVRGLWFF